MNRIEKKIKKDTIDQVLNKKAEANNTIDLNAYYLGLEDMYDYMIETMIGKKNVK